MTIDQQLRDRFDRITDGPVPEPDLATTIAAGRRRRRRRATSYAIGSLAVVAVTAGALAAPHLGGSPDPVPTVAAPDDGSFVPGTAIDTDLADAVAAAVPALPTARDVYPSDWNRDDAMPAADFADATEWQLFYDLSPQDELLVYVSKTLPGDVAPLDCGGHRPPGETCSTQQVADGELGVFRQTVGLGDDQRFWFVAALQTDDGRYISVMERIPATAGGWPDAERRRVLTDADLVAIARARGLDFPDPQTWPPAP